MQKFLVGKLTYRCKVFAEWASRHRGTESELSSQDLQRFRQANIDRSGINAYCTAAKLMGVVLHRRHKKMQNREGIGKICKNIFPLLLHVCEFF